jgi:hypothetical protein
MSPVLWSPVLPWQITPTADLDPVREMNEFIDSAARDFE